MSKLDTAVAATLCLGLLLTQCSPAREGGSGFAADPASAFSVTAEVTPAALDKLKAIKGGLVMTVSYYGYPTEAARPKANRLRQIDLGSEKYVVDLATRKVDFQGRLNKAGLGDVVEGEVRVLVGGYSVTVEGAKDAQVKCDYYRERLAVAQKASPVLKCDVVPY